MVTGILQCLQRCKPPWIFLDLVSEEDLRWLPERLYCDNSEGVALRVLRGKKMRSFQAMMDEFGAALQFFDGFGENWPALRECLSYLDEWMSASQYLLVVSRPSEVLADDPSDLPALLEILAATGRWWSEPITNNDRFNRPAIPFHVILQVRDEERETVLARFGDIPSLPRTPLTE